MLKLHSISHSSGILGSDSPQSNNKKGNSIQPPWETYTNVKHAIASYLGLPRPTPAPALMREHRSWTEVPGYAPGNQPEDYGQIRGGYSFPWMIAVD